MGECICGHYYSELREHSFTSYTCEPLEEGFFVNGYSWVSGHDYHRKISVCECGFESESVEEHNYGPDNDSQLCLLCGQSRPTCTMYLFREDDPIGAIYGLNRLPNVEFGTIFELPDYTALQQRLLCRLWPYARRPAVRAVVLSQRSAQL